MSGQDEQTMDYDPLNNDLRWKAKMLALMLAGMAAVTIALMRTTGGGGSPLNWAVLAVGVATLGAAVVLSMRKPQRKPGWSK